MGFFQGAEEGWGLVHLLESNLPPFSHPLGIKDILKLIVLNIYEKIEYIEI